MMSQLREESSDSYFSYLKPAMRAEEVRVVVAFWKKNKQEISTFLNHFNSLTLIQQRKGFWVLSHFAKHFPQELIPLQELIFSIFKLSIDRSIRREIFSILFNIKCADEIESHMLHSAFTVLTDNHAAVAERHHALQWLFRGAKNYPEIIPELVTNLEMGKESLTPSWKNYSEKLIQELLRGKVRKV
jgi:hypothetical protein